MNIDPSLSSEKIPSNTLQPASVPNGSPQPLKQSPPPSPPQQQQPRKRKAKTPASSTKTKKITVAPLHATVEVRGYEITIPNAKTCWRVSVVHACGHPIIEVSEVRYPDCDRPLIIEINRHMKPCTAKCKMGSLDHVVDGLCQECRQMNKEQQEQQWQHEEQEEDMLGLDTGFGAPVAEEMWSLWDDLPHFGAPSL